VAKTAQMGTIVGYDCITGAELFTEANRVTTNPDQTYALPKAGDYYRASDDKNYFIVGIRNTSTAALWQMDVLEELPAQEPNRTREEAKARRVHSITDLNLWLGDVKHRIQNCIEQLKITTDEAEVDRIRELIKKLEWKRDALTDEIKRLAN
jgi:hypothetical protein